MKNIEKVFTTIYDNNQWNSLESKSGPGSEVKNNLKLLDILKNFVAEHQIKSILDLGCGDFNWMRHFDFNLIETYLGIDVVDSEIQNNNDNYSSSKIKFEHNNIIDYQIKQFDIIICKDVLVHLSYNDSLQILDNIKKSKSKFLLSTSFENFINKDIVAGHWRPINLIDEPFNLGDPSIYYPNIENRNDEYNNKGIGIWILQP